MNTSREEQLIKTFFVRERRERFLMMLRKPRRRAKALDELNHLRDLDSRLCVELSPTEDAEACLRSRAAPDACYVLSDIAELDGREMPLGEAIEKAAAAGWGTLIDCIPGRLAYYFGEFAEQRLILERN